MVRLSLLSAISGEGSPSGQERKESRSKRGLGGLEAGDSCQAEASEDEERSRSKDEGANHSQVERSHPL